MELMEHIHFVSGAAISSRCCQEKRLVSNVDVIRRQVVVEARRKRKRLEVQERGAPETAKDIEGFQWRERSQCQSMYASTVVANIM